MMAEFDWKKLVAGIAPVLGTALAGPLAGQAISMLGEALGLGAEASETRVANTVMSNKLTGEQIVAMQVAEQDFKARMESMRIDVLKINAAQDAAFMADTADARHTFGEHDNVFTMGVLILVTFGSVMVLVLIGLFYLMTGKVTVEPGTLAVCAGLIGTIVGALGANAQQVVSFFYGSSKGSKDSGQAIGQALTESIKQTAVATDALAAKNTP